MPADAGAGICPSCGAVRAGRYCAGCGERFLVPHDLALKHYLTEHLPHELLHVDGKLPATLRSLFTRPGELAVHYCAGRRRPYFAPLRLYVVVFLVNAFLMGLGGQHRTLPERAAAVDPTGVVAMLAARRHDIDWQDPRTTQRLEGRTHWMSELGTMLIVFAMAAAQLLVFRRFHRRYLEHLALALEVTTFFIGLVAAMEIAALLIGRGTIDPRAETIRDIATSIALPIYWFAAIKRFYGTGTGAAIGYAVVTTLINSAIGQVFNILVFSLLVVTA